ncbi:hypothetical protein [Spartinivicinus poritis]|uniref:Uncharacterized protein n=1 Tax=Spartinivicinus poritis TaxID=2994640 RepID=A0ABT5UFG5_9GAMM|nr:hypothetical protein [Spartinivicinus sp. A2-2]MDE1465125.1 hypothetical protein [Spartinivicinus sp. A2-2]
MKTVQFCLFTLLILPFFSCYASSEEETTNSETESTTSVSNQSSAIEYINSKDFTLKRPTDNCQLRLPYLRYSADEQITLQSDSLSCQDGYLSGKGKVELVDNKGTTLETFHGFFKRGFVFFNSKLQSFPITARRKQFEEEQLVLELPPIVTDNDEKLPVYAILAQSENRWSVLNPTLVVVSADDTISKKQIQKIVTNAKTRVKALSASDHFQIYLVTQLAFNQPLVENAIYQGAIKLSNEPGSIERTTEKWFAEEEQRLKDQAHYRQQQLFNIPATRYEEIETGIIDAASPDLLYSAEWENTGPAGYQFLPFDVAGWQPDLANQELITSKQAKQYTLYNVAETCSINLPKLKGLAEPKGPIAATNLPCRNNQYYGGGSLRLSDQKTAITGFFYQGIPFSDDLINGYPLAYRFNTKSQAMLAVYIGSTPWLATHYYALLAFDKQALVFNTTPIKVAAITEDARWYTDPTLEGLMVEEAARLIDQFSQGKLSEISLVGYGLFRFPVPNQNLLHYQTHLQKEENQWTQVANSTSNHVLIRYQQQQVRLTNMQKDWGMLKQANFYQKINYLHKEFLFEDTPMELAAASLITGKPWAGATVVRVNNLQGLDASTDWPYPIKLESGGHIDSEGWYIIKGRVSAEELANSLLPKPIISVTEAIACEEDQCSEYNNIINLVRQKYNELEWSPKENQ